MSTSKRIVSGVVAFALLAATSMTAIPAGAATPIERFDAMGLTPMPDAVADAQRGALLGVPTILYYAAVYGVPLSVKAAYWVSTTYKPGSVAALRTILRTHFGCTRC